LIAIDTSVAVGFLLGRKSTVSALLSAQNVSESIGISSVSLFELLHPIHHRKLAAQERVVKSFVHQLRLLPLDSDAAEDSAKIMGSLLRIGKPVNALDVLIAGTALANGAERLISRDRDYEKIAGVCDLKVEILD
jgi:predicted nucleic acid-binding protein